MEEMKHSLEELPADYGLLLDGHAKLHGKLFNRMRLDLGGGAVGTNEDDEGPGDGYTRNWLHFLTVTLGVNFDVL